MGKLIPNAFNLAVVIFVALGSTACSYGMAIIGYVELFFRKCSYSQPVSSTIGQPSFYKSLKLAPQGEPGYGRTAEYIGAFNGKKMAVFILTISKCIFLTRSFLGVNSAGSAIGAAACAYCADRFSRKKTIQWGAMILVVGAAICAGSVNNAMFLVGRVINGLGIGALVTAIPMVSYFSRSRSVLSCMSDRSKVSSRSVDARVSRVYGLDACQSRSFTLSYSCVANRFKGVMFAMGYTLSAWIGFGVSFISTSGSTSSFPWRFPIAFQMVPALMLLVGSPWLPFSPRWLMMQDRCDEAHEVIKRLHRTKNDPHDSLARKEYYQMKKQVELDRQIRASTSRWEIFKTPPNRRRALVGFVLMWNNQFTGVQLPVTQITQPANTRTGIDHCELRCHSLYQLGDDRLLATTLDLTLGPVDISWQYLLCLLRRKIWPPKVHAHWVDGYPGLSCLRNRHSSGLSGH